MRLCLRSAISTLIAVAVSLLFVSTPALAYEEDSHFLMTYVLCRSAGFTDQEALIVAAVDQGMDDSVSTNAHDDGKPQIEEEWRWHALDLDGKMHAAGIIARRDLLFQEAIEEIDPRKKLIRLGIFFHYQQDTWAHRHHEKSNHLSRNAYTTFNTPTGHGPWGSKPDRPPLDPVAALMCLEDGIVFAVDFLRRGLKREPNTFFANYSPNSGKVDKKWKDKRNGKYFRQLDVSNETPESAGLYLRSLIAAQIDTYTRSRDLNPFYFGSQTPDKADFRKMRSNLQAVCDLFAASVGEISMPTDQQKLDQGFTEMTTSYLLALSEAVTVSAGNVDTILEPGDFMFKYLDTSNKAGLPAAGVAFETLISGVQKAFKAGSEEWNANTANQRFQFRQALEKGDPNAVHMGIYLGDGWIAEAYGTSLGGASVNKWHLFKDHNLQTWYVFRAKDKEFAKAVTSVADRWSTSRIKYLIPAQAVLTSSTFGPSAKKRALVYGEAYDTEGGPASVDKMFCSQFAIAVAQSVAIKQFIKQDGETMTADLLDNLPEEFKLDALSSPVTVYGVWEKSGAFEIFGPVYIEESSQ